MAAQVVDGVELEKDVAGGQTGLTIGCRHGAQLESELELELVAEVVAGYGQPVANPGVVGSIVYRSAIHRAGSLIESEPHGREVVDAAVERSLADLVEVASVSHELAMAMNGGFDELAGVGEVSVEGSQGKTGPLGDLLDGRNQRFLGKHFEDGVESGVDVALSAGDPPVDGCVGAVYVGHRSLTVAVT
ncbi:MAG: hypothetical protein F4129_11900 [Acidimicrobiia bacterium]|nr:hypothetical protein [Acidimicrobiia bacterium]